MNEVGIGVVYDLAKLKSNDGFHVETCGSNHYIVLVKDRNGGSCLIGLSRTQMYMMARSIIDHIEYMMKREQEESE